MTEHERSSLAAFIPPDRRTSAREYASRECVQTVNGDSWAKG
ncbi:hypothetical protein [Amycolatopsis sp. NPDC003676]